MNTTTSLPVDGGLIGGIRYDGDGPDLLFRRSILDTVARRFGFGQVYWPAQDVGDAVARHRTAPGGARERLAAQ